jgi:nucleotide-binding universal stress UspA family protein
VSAGRRGLFLAAAPIASRAATERRPPAIPQFGVPSHPGTTDGARTTGSRYRGNVPPGAENIAAWIGLTWSRDERESWYLLDLRAVAFIRVPGMATAAGPGEARATAAARRSRREAKDGPMHPFHTIVVAVDFSDTSMDAIDAALELARGQQNRVHLLNVVPDVFHSPGLTEAPGVDWPQVQRNCIDQARNQLVELAANCKLDPQRITIAVEVGAPAPEIVRYASEHDGRVIVLGSHGHGVVRRFMLGSVADRVLRQASCPVLFVPHRSLRMTPSEVTAAVSVD